MRAGPERDLVDDYIKRAQSLSRQTGFISVNEQVMNLKRCKSRSEETAKLLSNIPNAAKIIILDERGKSLKSRIEPLSLLNIRSGTTSDMPLSSMRRGWHQMSRRKNRSFVD